MRQIDGIDYEEMNGSGAVKFSRGGITGTRLLKVVWESRLTFCDAILSGGSVMVGGISYPRAGSSSWELPDGTVLYCDAATYVGIGKSSGADLISYDFAMITAEYSTISGTSRGSGETGKSHGSESLDFGAEFLSSPKGTWKFSGGEKIDEPIGILSCYTEISLSIDGMKYLPRVGIRNCRGRLNNATWQGIPSGYVLFLGASSQRDLTDDGRSAYDVVFKFKEKDRDWNEFLAKDGEWKMVVDEASATINPYLYANFDVLLSVSSSDRHGWWDQGRGWWDVGNW